MDTREAGPEPELVILFFSRLTQAAGEDYRRMDQELAERVRQNPGFAGVKSFTAEDGERLTLVWWRDEASLGEWRNLERHRLAQQTGRERWYQYYRMQVARIFRRSAFTREGATSS
jgi:heme-degrading monooxygenase HmoA